MSAAISGLIATLGREHPALWRTCYPRAYADTGAWHSPKYPAAFFGLSAMRSANNPISTWPGSLQNAYVVAAQCARHTMPTYFVGRSLIEAISRSAPPADLDWQTMAMPFPGLTFILPKGAFRHPIDGECGFVSIARAGHMEEIHFPALGCPRLTVNGGNLIAVAVTHEPENFNMFDASLAKDSPTIGGISAAHGVYDHFGADGMPVQKALEPEEKDFTTAMFGLAIRLVLVMMARPEIVSPGSSNGKASKASGVEFWTPNIIGKNYRITVESSKSGSDGGHGSPRLHWRRGHFRQQAFGTGMSQHRTLWIEPTLVGGDQ